MPRCIVDSRGRKVATIMVEHTTAGLRDLIGFLERHGVGEVAIERPDGPVIDVLLDAELTVVVISPNQVKNMRGRYGSAVNKDNRFDAYVLADTLRTDEHDCGHQCPTQRPPPPCVGPAAPARTWPSTVWPRPTSSAHLRNVFPGAIGLFKDIDSEISLAFLTRFDTQDRADWLTPKRLGDWLSKQAYSARTDPAILHQRLLNAPCGATGTHATSQTAITASCIALPSTLVEQIKTLSAQIERQLHEHADAHIFTSLPRSGRVRAARVLAEIGDCRARFSTPESLTCLAGAAPSTRQSGKLRAVGFRWSCDKQLRDAVTDFANGSRDANPWAADLYDRARARGHDHAHAIRILVSDDPRSVLSVIQLSRASYRKMKRNLWWAAGYNIAAVPLAAGVLAPIGFVLPMPVGAITAKTMRRTRPKVGPRWFTERRPTGC